MKHVRGISGGPARPLRDNAAVGQQSGRTLDSTPPWDVVVEPKDGHAASEIDMSGELVQLSGRESGSVGGDADAAPVQGDGHGDRVERPNPENQPVQASVNDAQTHAWERDPRVSILRRDLNYRGWPALPPQEKGVDVALAVDLIETALLGQYDVGIVFSGDTDLLPAIEVAFRRTPPRIQSG